ncbi:MAG: peptidase S10 [Parachlamydiaceae bacterium]|nr:peptidase S10 [Parachlamydiaceae bacterium]
MIKNIHSIFAICLSLSLSISSVLTPTALSAASPASLPTENASNTEKLPNHEKITFDPVHEIVSVTDHVVTIKGVEVAYQATAGALQQKNEKGEHKASLFYVSYKRTNGEDTNKRPIAFCFNGGPGAAAVWLHMGLLGPKRVVVSNDTISIPPYSYIENEYSLLDAVDLVFIDPVSTGYSRTTGNEDAKQFHGVEEDIKSVAEFIRLFATQNGRWESPKFLIGESYGTTRAALLADYLQDELYMYLNGLVLVSSVLDFQTIDKMERSNDLTYLLYLPTYTAAAWYHKKLPDDLQKKDLRQVIQESKTFAIEEYSLALLKGNQLPPQKRKEIVAKLSYLSGLPPQFIERMNMRVSVFTFIKELLKNEGKVIGRFDSRLTGIDLDPCSCSSEFDPSLDGVIGVYTAAFNQYARTDLKWVSNEEYKTLTDVFPWNYGKSSNQYLNAGTSLRKAMTKNPLLQVFVACGLFDLATPLFATEYTYSHLGLDPSLNQNITLGHYEAGHMMFNDMPSLVKLSGDLHEYVGKVLEQRGLPANIKK